MDGISVYSEEARTTWVPNEFIDEYMPRANGTFVKVYLYLLRCLTSPDAGFGINVIADALEETEKDILRALRYWEKEQVLCLSWKDTKKTELSGIKLLRLSRPLKEQPADPVSAEDGFSMSASGKDSVMQLSSVTVTDSTSFAPLTGASPADSSMTRASSSILPDYSPEQIEAFSENNDTAWLLHAVAQYLERLLKPADVQLILFFHEELHFSSELILHLYEYCVSRGKKASSYIQKVGISWHEHGIDTVKKAEEAALSFDATFTAVNRAFALGRTPGIAEQRFINRWASLGFSADIIEEACSRTLLRISRPDFRFADKILNDWHEKGVHTLGDVQRLDHEHAKSRAAEPVRNTKNNTGSQNRFNSFPQRDYSGSELSELERALLGNNASNSGQ